MSDQIDLSQFEPDPADVARYGEEEARYMAAARAKYGTPGMTRPERVRAYRNPEVKAVNGTSYWGVNLGLAAAFAALTAVLGLSVGVVAGVPAAVIGMVAVGRRAAYVPYQAPYEKISTPFMLAFLVALLGGLAAKSSHALGFGLIAAGAVALLVVTPIAASRASKAVGGNARR